MHARFAISWLAAGAAACAHLPGGRPDAASPAADPRPRVLLARPADDGHVVRLPVALAEIAGAALTPDGERHEVAVALDFSRSAFEPTGRDVDGDGTIGALQPWRPAVGGQHRSPFDWTSDPDDSVAGAELTATRTLLERLDPAGTRVAVLSFGSSVAALAPLSTPEAALAALARPQLGAQIGGTNVSAALTRAARVLAASADGPPARRTILLVTDGFPTLPPPQPRAEQAVTEAAEELAAAGIRVQVLAIVAATVEPSPALEELARLTGGSFERVDDPTELPVRLANTSLSGVRSVEVRNATSGAAGLAVRLLPDGRFDAFVPLVRGDNVIEVQARSPAGASDVVRRTVRWEPPAVPPAESPEAAALLDELRQRTLEVEALTQLRERRQQQHRELRVEPAAP